MENRPCRPQRNRRHSRRAWPPEDDVHHVRPEKRLFTPEIKRMLKDWLIRRRENPYPSRDEKKRLAIETGLTYTQICNWFANWRRKLKNSEREKAKKSWGHLIKHYNTNARGNVEQFSISSEDSIWEEEENGRINDIDNDDDDDDDDDFDENEDYSDSEMDDLRDMSNNAECNGGTPHKPIVRYMHTLHEPKFYMETVKMEHSNYYNSENGGINTTAQCYQISSTTSEYESNTGVKKPKVDSNIIIYDYGKSNQQEEQLQQQQQQLQQQKQQLQTFLPNKAKYKQQMMEKYLRDTNEGSGSNHNSNSVITMPSTVEGATDYAAANGKELSKWLESAAKFTPNKNNYFIEWNKKRNKLEKKQRPKPVRKINTTLPAANGPIYSKLQQQKQNYVQNASNHQHVYDTIHHKDELDAAEALANLAFNCRQRMLDSTNLYSTPPTTNAIPSS